MAHLCTYQNGFAPRDGMPKYPSLWHGCVFAAAPCIGPTGTTLRDVSPRRKHGTLQNVTAAQLWTLDQGKYAASFGTTAHNIVFDQVISVAGPFTISFWMRSSNSSTLWRTLISFSNSSGDGIFVQSGSQLLYFEFAVGTKTFGTVGTGQWVHVAVTRSTSDVLRAWINGVVSSNEPTRSGTITIDRISDELSGFAADAKMDDIRIYDHSISAQEIKLLAVRRGIAYELDEQQLYPGTNRRRRVLIGA